MTSLSVLAGRIVEHVIFHRLDMGVIKLSVNTHDIQIYMYLFLARKRLSVMLNLLSCADPEGGAGGPDPPP